MRVFYFEIPAGDCERAKAFYSKAFGWTYDTFPAETPYYFIRTGEPSEPGIDGGLMQRFAEGQPVTNIVRVDSVDEACRVIEEAGGEVVVPKFEIPGVGWKAYFKDTEGNIFGVAEMPG
jgi:uncharacterized protein